MGGIGAGWQFRARGNSTPVYVRSPESQCVEIERSYRRKEKKIELKRSSNSPSLSVCSAPTAEITALARATALCLSLIDELCNPRPTLALPEKPVKCPARSARGG
jgi:hypothetical protein